jgi:hypothetical protein
MQVHGAMLFVSFETTTLSVGFSPSHYFLRAAGVHAQHWMRQEEDLEPIYNPQPGAHHAS